MANDKKDEPVMKQRCSFCKREVEIHDSLDMPIYDPATGFGICKNCIKELAHYIELHEEDTAKKQAPDFAAQLDEILKKNKPHIIKQYLDEYIINQDRAKKILSVAVYNHYKRMKYGYTNDDGTEIEKSNVIMLGPSGCGKTALLSHLSKLLDVPFAVTDASSLTEAGFVGADVEVAVRNLYYAADKDIQKAEHGIIYLDEFDKIARKSGANNSITADPGHEGVQQALLKMLEGNVVEFTARGQRKHPEAPTIKVDTKNILFICGGAFDGIERKIAQRLNTHVVGYNSVQNVKKIDKKDMMKYILPQDLKSFGLIPEIIGRLPVLTYLNPLDKEALRSILVEPKNSIVKQYQKLFEIDGIKLEFEDGVFDFIVDKAMEYKLGARGLRSIVESVMMDAMFDVPSENVKEFTVTLDYAKSQLDKAHLQKLETD